MGREGGHPGVDLSAAKGIDPGLAGRIGTFRDRPSPCCTGTARDRARMKARTEVPWGHVWETENGLSKRFKPDRIRVLFNRRIPPTAEPFLQRQLHSVRVHPGAFERVFVPTVRGRRLPPVTSRLGCYLDDLCLDPVNHLKREPQSNAGRIETVREGLPYSPNEWACTTRVVVGVVGPSQRGSERRSRCRRKPGADRTPSFPTADGHAGSTSRGWWNPRRTSRERAILT